MVLGVLLSALFAACTPLQPTVDPFRVFESRSFIDKGVAQLREGNLNDAAASFEVAYELAPLPAAIDGMGCVYFMQGRLQDAERHFIAAYHNDESYSPALAHLALLYESQGYIAEAQALYRQAVRGEPRLFRDRNNFAGLLYDRGGEGVAEARKELLRAHALAPHPLVEENLRIVNGVDNVPGEQD